MGCARPRLLTLVTLRVTCCALAIVTHAGCTFSSTSSGATSSDDSDAGTTASTSTAGTSGASGETTAASVGASTGMSAAATMNSGASETSATGETDSTGASTSESGPALVIEGWGEVYEPPCDHDDRDCLARTVCELTTGSACVKQEWNCLEGYTGASYLAEGGAPHHVETTTFALHELSHKDAGNICNCDPDALAALGLATKHAPCTYGLWYMRGA